MGGELYLMRRGRKKKRMSPPGLLPTPPLHLQKLWFQNYSLGRVSGFLPFPVT
ncbi:uncharacterized protein G2W53_009866 [Senna tora]|uniref:Uncharacterized protein n=1 Tax=Senna tora TaxID=362788 RepID=A0A835CDD4_9FABA|nr:uncharacterized protein G2W53_009866 [Senna tora]